MTEHLAAIAGYGATSRALGAYLDEFQATVNTGSPEEIEAAIRTFASLGAANSAAAERLKRNLELVDGPE